MDHDLYMKIKTKLFKKIRKSSRLTGRNFIFRLNTKEQAIKEQMIYQTSSKLKTFGLQNNLMEDGKTSYKLRENNWKSHI